MSDYYISEATLRAILLDPSPTSTEIADRHGVSHQIVRLYKRLKTAKAAEMAERLRDEGLEPVLWDTKAPHKKLMPEQVEFIRASKAKSATLAKQFGCSSSLIRMIKTGKAYT